MAVSRGVQCKGRGEGKGRNDCWLSWADEREVTVSCPCSQEGVQSGGVEGCRVPAASLVSPGRVLIPSHAALQFLRIGRVEPVGVL